MIPADPLRNLGPATILRADARDLPLADNSVDLIVTSPPYFALRSYQDAGEHYAGQLGSEATPAEFVDALIACTREMVRVVKPSGSIWVNLGDKYSQRPGQNIPRTQGGILAATKAEQAFESRPSQGNTWDAAPPKSLLGIPWRYALRCIDDLGLILRAHVVWSKPNGLPESVTDRVRRSHEDWFHFVLEPRYYSAVDEIREEHAPHSWVGRQPLQRPPRPGGQDLPVNDDRSGMWMGQNPLGKLPGSVWTIPTEPLRVPDHLGIDHFAAFPSEWPKRIIRGWSPAGVCTACGVGRRPIVAEDNPRKSAEYRAAEDNPGDLTARAEHGEGVGWGGRGGSATGLAKPGWRKFGDPTRTITGYACACDPDKAKETAQRQADEFHRRTGIPVHWKDYYDAETLMPATRPAVILDPFGGTGTVAMVARALGRHGMHVDLSADYNRLAHWRITDLDQLAAVQGHQRTKRQPDDQPTLLDEIPEVSA